MRKFNYEGMVAMHDEAVKLYNFTNECNEFGMDDFIAENEVSKVLELDKKVKKWIENQAINEYIKLQLLDTENLLKLALEKIHLNYNYYKNNYKK